MDREAAPTNSGKGIAVGSSVYDHAFAKGDAFSLWVREVVKCGTEAKNLR
jgi:hypothetical protein